MEAELSRDTESPRSHHSTTRQPNLSKNLDSVNKQNSQTENTNQQDANNTKKSKTTSKEKRVEEKQSKNVVSNLSVKHDGKKYHHSFESKFTNHNDDDKTDHHSSNSELQNSTKFPPPKSNGHVLIQNGNSQTTTLDDYENQNEIDVQDIIPENDLLNRLEGSGITEEMIEDPRLIPAFVGKLVPLTKTDVRVEHLKDPMTRDNVQLFYNIYTESIIFISITTGRKINIEYTYETDDERIKHKALKDTGIVKKYIKEFSAIPEETRGYAYEHALYHLKKLDEDGQSYLNLLISNHKAMFKKAAPKKNKEILMSNDVPTSADGTILVGAKRINSDGKTSRPIKRKKDEFSLITLPVNPKTKIEQTPIKSQLIAYEMTNFELMKRRNLIELTMQRNKIAQLQESNEEVCNEFLSEIKN